MTTHSPLGFSGLYRYTPCPGSVALIAALPPDAVPADPEYTRTGTAAHAAWAWCLREGTDAWEAAVQEWEGHTLSEEDLEAGQFYLDTIAASLPLDVADVEELIECSIHAPEIHELAYGTLDHVLIFEGGTQAILTDYKHGEGQFVEVKDNPQLLGYAALLLSKYPALQHFKLRVVQPRFAGETQAREWPVPAEYVRAWIEKDLKPAMNRAMHSKALSAGEWCRFCPVQKALACPQHNQLVPVIEEAIPLIATMTNERMDELSPKVELLKMSIRSFENELLRRTLAGVKFQNSKAVAKKVFRRWRDTARNALMAALGPCVLTEPELKSPAVMEKLGKIAKQLTKEYAFSPDAGLTTAPITDPRRAVEVPKLTADTFDKYIDNSPEIE